MSALAQPSNKNLDLISGQISTPLELFEAVAHKPKFAHVLWKAGRKEASISCSEKVKEWYTLNDKNYKSVLTACEGESDIFYTPNEFYGWRLARLLVALNAFYVDIDVHDESGCPQQATLDALDKISAARLPAPNFVVHTGRGAHIYWLFNRTTGKALSRWQAVQRELVRIAGGDRNVVDCTRVLRLVGTVNSKAKQSRKTVTAEIFNRQRYEFDWLCDQIIVPRTEIRDLRVTRAEIRDLSVARVQHAGGKIRTGRNQNTIGVVWAHRLQDITKIIRMNWKNGCVDQGQRNNMLFYAGVALSWICQPEALKTELHKFAEKHMPTLSEEEIDNALLSVTDRAQKAALGEKISGADPRYRFKSQTLYEAFEPLILSNPAIINELKSILPRCERSARRRSYESLRDRVAEGRYKQSQAQRTASKLTRMQEALQLIDAGLTARQIADELDMTVRTIQRYIKTHKEQQLPLESKGIHAPIFEKGEALRGGATEAPYLNVGGVPSGVATTPGGGTFVEGKCLQTWCLESRYLFSRELGKDKYHHTVGNVWQGVNYAMVFTGYLWASRAYVTDLNLLQIEATARGQNFGFWIDPNLIGPWKFLKLNKKEKRK